jgi:hypothetical protein
MNLLTSQHVLLASVLVISTLGTVTANYDCYCSGHVIRILYPCENEAMTSTGYMFYQECWPVATHIVTSPGWAAIVHNSGHVSFLFESHLARLKICLAIVNEMPVCARTHEHAHTHTHAQTDIQLYDTCPISTQ